MTSPRLFGAPAAGPGEGPGWSQLAAAVAAALPGEEVDGVWVFPPIRSGPVEWGTAVLSRVDGERRRIYTARYAHTIKGKERGRFQWELQEVGSGPLDALEALLAQVPARADAEEPPVAVAPDRWLPRAGDDGGPGQG